MFAGLPLAKESIATIDYLEKAQYIRAHNRHLFTPSSPLYQCWQDGLLGWLEDWQPDVLIVEANPRYLSTPRAVQWMHQRKRPVIGWGLGAPALGGPLAIWRRWSRQSFLKPLDAIISYSQQGALEYGALGFPAERVFVARNAVAPRPEKPPVERPDEFMGRPGVLFVGRLQARKRVDNLLHACAALPEALQPRLWIVGDGPARQEFEALAESIYPQAEFIGARQGTELEAYFAAADVFVLPTRADTYSMVALEAMAMGLPVITTNVGGIPDIVVEGETGYLLQVDDRTRLRERLRALRANRPLRLAMGAKGRIRAEQRFNLDTHVSTVLDLLFAAAHSRRKETSP